MRFQLTMDVPNNNFPPSVPPRLYERNRSNGPAVNDDHENTWRVMKEPEEP